MAWSIIIYDERRVKVITVVILALYFGVLEAAETLPGEAAAQRVTDEKGVQPVALRPSLLSIFIGNRFGLPDTTQIDNAKSFATQNMLRTDEVIYKSSGASLKEAAGDFVAEPVLRIEWDTPFERVAFLPAWPRFSAQLSFEGGLSATKNLLVSEGSFRYQNAQANHPALTDLTYTGALTVSERRQHITPMLGVGIELTNATLQKLQQLRFLIRFAAGVSLQNGQRSYDLSLNPQYVSAGSYSDSYAIKSAIQSSYAMAILPAGRVELGARMRLSSKLHLSIVGSLTVLYGILPYDNLGSFTEQAGVDKVIYQKIIANISDQDYLGLIPAAFLALSLEI